MTFEYLYENINTTNKGKVSQKIFPLDFNLQKRCNITPFLQVESAQGRDGKLFMEIGVKVKHLPLKYTEVLISSTYRIF